MDELEPIIKTLIANNGEIYIIKFYSDKKLEIYSLVSGNLIGYYDLDEINNQNTINIYEYCGNLVENYGYYI